MDNKKPWKANYHEKYYVPWVSPHSNNIEVDTYVYNDEPHNTMYYDYGLMCKTEQEAYNLGRYLIQKARELKGF